MTTHDESLNGSVRFFDQQIRALYGQQESIRILDFGCGSGRTVTAFRALGYDAVGCDIGIFCTDGSSVRDFLRPIETGPYRLPYANATFDGVVSSSVFEHAQNKEECFREIHRVLKMGGYAIHVLPGKWYLPTEPHIYVPLVSWFWPNVPTWWLAVWARLGVRNEHQQGKTWHEVTQLNVRYCATGLSYWSWRQYRRVSAEIYGNSSFPMERWVEHGGGGFNRLVKALPHFMHGFAHALMRACRMGVLQQQKINA